MAHLTIDERFRIYEMNKSGYSSRYIGKNLGSDKSTICYELKKVRNNYRPDRAHTLALSLRNGKRKRKLDIDYNLQAEIIEQLTQGISPDIISGRRKLSPNTVNISTESIYQFIYRSPIAQRQKLYLSLAWRRQDRLHHGTRIRKKRVTIPNRVSITERPEMNRKIAAIGHLEGDLTFNKGNQSRNIGGLVDISTQKVFLTLNRSKRTKEVIGNMNKKLKTLSHIIKSITLDNGTEFTNHEKLLPKSNRKVYFCNAYSPWQKPLIEKINSMVHRVYSKSSDITKLTIKQLQKIEDFLNNLPRKALGYKTPNEVWEENINLA
ncbi:MAG TPA: IS30 family transposase [Rickettsia endosymbiont of Ceroptres masudai]|nr:IS30 family transposase [Rickettsia endosymbiont of Ceroptres masudai]